MTINLNESIINLNKPTVKLSAIKLANELINWYPKINLCVVSAIMLRQQADKIDELEIKNIDLNKKADTLTLINNFQIKEIEQLTEKIEAMLLHIVHGEPMPQIPDFLYKKRVKNDY